MTDTILFEGPGYTIAQSDIAETLVPYFPAKRPDGYYNYGWVDLRDRPDLAETIAEAKKSPGLTAFLKAIAAPDSRVMSGACDCHSFDRNGELIESPRWQVGGYAEIMFKDAERNRDPQNLIDLSCFLLRGVSGTDRHHIGFEFVVEPLKQFFGNAGCFAVMAKAHGLGASEAQAWAGFDYAMHALATSLVRNRGMEAQES